MSYYEDKKDALKDVEGIINKGGKATIDSLEYFLMSKYGFGKKVLESILNVLEAHGSITTGGDTVKWKK